ncbi:MAG: gluconokinase [Gammaproteobacteria bacterium]|nr:gluconokinase [Gammaproteobacteria bacterium]
MILVVIGVSGTGKSTLGRALAGVLGWEFIEGDDFHPPGNIEKMQRHIPLNDADRIPWLERLHQQIQGLESRRQHGVLACSALKRNYRDLLDDAISDLYYIFLCGNPALIRERIRSRTAHFMPADLLDDQIAILEPPEDALLVPIDITTEQQVALVLETLEGKKKL